MANWSLPTTGSTYVNYTSELNARLNDLAYGLDPAVTTASNTLTNFIRYSSTNSRWEKYNGSAWVALASVYAISISGSAATLGTARAIAISGDATGTANFDGSANISIAATLANSGVGAGTYGSATAVPAVTVDAKGRITSVTTNTVTPAWSNITGKPTTVAGFGITDAVSNAGSTPSIQAGAFASRPVAGTTGRLYVATDTMVTYRDNGSTWDVVTPAYTGDATKAVGGTAITLSNSGVTAGTYTKVTVDAKGRVTVGASLASADVTTALGFTPYNATNPNGYVTSSNLASYLPLGGGTLTGDLTMSGTGKLKVPSGSTAQRPASPATGDIRFNSTLGKFEGYGSAWGTIGGGATGAAGDDVFYENGQTITANYTITANKNAMTAGPVTVNDGVSVTVPDNCVWTVV